MPKTNPVQQVLANKGDAIDDADIVSPAAENLDSNRVSGSTRVDRIRLAAYLKAERRGFLSGYEESDWLEAEQEVDAQGRVGSGDGEASSQSA